MTGFDREALKKAVAEHGRVTRVAIAAVRGSSPREVGAAMLVWASGQSGTIGGGTLEYHAAKTARTQTQYTESSTHALGPDLGQCCGGSVTLISELYDAARCAALTGDIIARPIHATAEKTPPFTVKRILASARNQGQRPDSELIDGWFIEPVHKPSRPVWIWGAGHVGRAIVSILAPIPDLDITWVDTSTSRFPKTYPSNITVLPAADPVRVVHYAPKNTAHVILTYSHKLDLALCNALLAQEFSFAGVIGSSTKWARFRRQLVQLGHSAEAPNRITCPIGDPSLGKHPQMIAVGVAAELLRPAQAAAEWNKEYRA
ncbi:xanthine dehydrogenase accessory protein XdhC [Epibacterium ulvae]|uniref:xanthine dehydrogenase accessory protein XdhC n=1 Tax=Epibacterium ulvae TaxID=1156985 RepID=UPI00249014ED|nr:xanthine dehydrogenase accessory protein XdhC [Epibacterium ulvae]